MDEVTLKTVVERYSRKIEPIVRNKRGTRF
jgi:hypothetical protein